MCMSAEFSHSDDRGVAATSGCDHRPRRSVYTFIVFGAFENSWSVSHVAVAQVGFFHVHTDQDRSVIFLLLYHLVLNHLQ